MNVSDALHQGRSGLASLRMRKLLLQGWALIVAAAPVCDAYRRVQEYYAAHDPMADRHGVAIPTLLINAEDDFVCPVSLARPDVIVREQPGALLLVTRSGKPTGCWTHQIPATHRALAPNPQSYPLRTTPRPFDLRAVHIPHGFALRPPPPNLWSRLPRGLQ